MKREEPKKQSKLMGGVSSERDGRGPIPAPIPACNPSVRTHARVMSLQPQHRRRGATRPILAACGEDKPAAAAGGGGKVPAAEYPCVRRTRHRRLLTFLWLQGFKTTFESMIGETDSFFSVPVLRQLVEKGQWKDACGYLSRFLPACTSRVVSEEAHALHRFLECQFILASIVDGTTDGELIAAKYKTYINHGKTVYSGLLRIRSIFLNALHAKQHFRASFDWERVRHKASEIVDDLAYRTPELKELVLMPSGPMKPHNVLSIGFGLRPRHSFKKQVRRPLASTLAKRFLLKKRQLPVFSNHLQESDDAIPSSVETSELLDKALIWAADAIDDCLIAGKRQERHQESQLSSNESAPCNPACMKSMVSSVRGTGALAAPVYQTTYGNMAGLLRNPWVPVLANANKFAVPVLRTPTTPGAPFSGTMFRVPVSQTMLPNHMATPGAPFSTTIFLAPVSQTVFGCLTNPDKSSGISLMTTAGTNYHPSQENVESSHRTLNQESHPRAELTTSNEQDL